MVNSENMLTNFWRHTSRSQQSLTVYICNILAWRRFTFKFEDRNLLYGENQARFINIDWLILLFNIVSAVLILFQGGIKAMKKIHHKIVVDFSEPLVQIWQIWVIWNSSMSHLSSRWEKTIQLWIPGTQLFEFCLNQEIPTLKSFHKLVYIIYKLMPLPSNYATFYFCYTYSKQAN